MADNYLERREQAAAQLAPCGMNRQELRYRLVTSEEADKVLPHIKLGGALPLKPLAVIAIGKPAENIYITRVHEGDSLAYYRKDGVHFVPKIELEEVLI